MNPFRLSLVSLATLLLSSSFLGVSFAQTALSTFSTADLPLVSLQFETPDLANGTLNGDASIAAGLAGNALTLNGTGSVELRQNLDTSKSYTVTTWVKLAKIGGYQTFISSDGPRNSAFFLQLRDDSKRFAFTLLPEGEASGAQAMAQDDAEVGVWTHLAGVYDAQKRAISLYVNGVLQDTMPFEAAYRAPGPLRLGRAKYGGNAVDFSFGQLDNAQIFQSALTPLQIAARVKPLAQAIKPVSFLAATLPIDVSKVRNRVSPTLYGLMTEEINHSYDGGLYGELIRNRSFQDDAGSAVNWSLLATGATATMSLDKTAPLNSASPVSLKLQIADARNGRAAVQNEGYWGIPIKSRTRYSASFWARASDDSQRPVTLSLESADQKTTFASAKVRVAGTGWKKYQVTLSTGPLAPTTGGRFVLATRKTGTLWLTQVSLFPPTYKNRRNGNRPDLMEKMAAMHPTYLRFPGGNYLEGNTIAERFDWKKTLGPIETRLGHRGPWNYRSSDGMGLSEFLSWCDDLKMEPVLAVYAGYSLGGQRVEPGPQLQPFVQDALDEISYLIGDKATIWGARRIADGHAAPFQLHYVEIGNEDFFDRSASYDGRFAQFYDAIKTKFPQLQLISTTMDAPLRVTSRKPDVIDEHYYLSAREMERRATHYDNYDRSGPKIFVGEWASHTERVPWQDPQQLNAPTPDMGAALGDAAFMTGLERNSDIVVMHCYAPLFVNVNPSARQWAPNLIGYDNLNSYGAPSYYAQSMFAGNVGNVVLDATIQGGSRLTSSVTRNTKNGQVFVKIVNPTATAQSVQISMSGAKTLNPNGIVTTLRAASPKATNSISNPTEIVPVTTKMSGLKPSFGYAAPAYSISVLELKAK